eukprot:444595_1
MSQKERTDHVPSNSPSNKQLAEFTVHVTQLGLLSLIASFWSLISSGLASLAFTQNWFDESYSRGAFIIFMGISSLIMRCIIVFCARRCGEKDRYLALIFIAIASFSDSIFDILQGCVLISGYEYSTSVNVIVIVGTWIGFTDELLEFIEEMIANCCQICEQELCAKAFKIWLFLILIDCITEQVCGIYIAVVTLADNADLIIFIISIILNVIAILIVIAFVAYLLYGGKARIKQLQNELQGHGSNVLLLGARDTGKSTVFKQIELLYADTMTQQEREFWRSCVRRQVEVDLLNAFGYLEELREQIEDGELHDDEHDELIQFLLSNDIPQEIKAAGQRLENYIDNNEWVMERADDIKLLWRDRCIQNVFSDYKHRNYSCINESTMHLLDDIDRFAAEDYLPTDQDVLITYYPTSMINIRQRKLRVGNEAIQVTDRSGRRGERKKWVHCYDSVSVVIFVASLSHYNEHLWEDTLHRWWFEDKANCMDDSIELFQKIVNLEALKDATMILLLNKKDLFEEKIKSIPITVCNSLMEFEGDTTDYDETMAYIKQQYESQNLNPKKRQVYTYIVCAINQSTIAHVLDQIPHFIKGNGNNNHIDT